MYLQSGFCPAILTQRICPIEKGGWLRPQADAGFHLPLNIPLVVILLFTDRQSCLFPFKLISTKTPNYLPGLKGAQRIGRQPQRKAELDLNGPRREYV